MAEQSVVFLMVKVIIDRVTSLRVYSAQIKQGGEKWQEVMRESFYLWIFLKAS